MADSTLPQGMTIWQPPGNRSFFSGVNKVSLLKR